MQAGITKPWLYGRVAPAATTWLKTCWPLTVTTIVSGSSEQFVSVPEMVIASPGRGEAGSRLAVSSTHGSSLQGTRTEACSVSLPESLVAVATAANGEFWPA